MFMTLNSIYSVFKQLIAYLKVNFFLVLSMLYVCFFLLKPARYFISRRQLSPLQPLSNDEAR